MCEDPPLSACPHSPRPFRSCRHLVEPSAQDAGFVLVFEGPEFAPVCRACAEAGFPEPAEICDRCRRHYLGVEAFGGFEGFVGAPGARVRDAGLAIDVETIDLRDVLRDRILEMAPVPGRGRARWVLWTASRRLVTVELPGGEVLGVAGPFPEDLLPERAQPRGEPRFTLVVSEDGRFVAVLRETTRHGVVVDLATGEIRIRLDRGDYHEDASGWPFAFTTWKGRTTAVHAIAWNRLAATDLDSGDVVRPPVREESGVDYFLGRLSISPGGRSIASAGWFWHPVGSVARFRLDRWLEGEEAGEALQYRNVNQTGYYWDGDNVWLDDDRLLVWGVGDDDSRMARAGVVYSSDAADEVVGWWPGLPMGALYVDRGNRRLFVDGEEGVSAWDLDTVERVAEVPGFSARGFHPTAGHLAGIVDPLGRLSIGFLRRRT